MNMSLSVRRTLLCRALVSSVIEMCREHGDASASPEAGIVLDRLARLVAGVLRQVSGGKDALQFDRKGSRRFLSSLDAVKAQMLATLPDGEVNPSAWCAAVLLWVEDHKDKLPPFPPERRHTWFKIAENLQALLEILSPEHGETAVDDGIGYGEALKRASGVW